VSQWKWRLVTEVGREDAQSEFPIVDGTELRRETSIASQVTADTQSVAGFVGGRTPEGIFWSFGEPLTRLGEKWLGNSFTTLASLISVYSMANVWATPPQETMDHMVYHFTDVSAFTL
jgi:hypothetical protein